MGIKLFDIFRNNYIISLDIGSSAIKLAQFKRKKDGLFLIKADLRDFSLSNEGNLRDQEIISALKSFFKEINLEKQDFVLTVNSPKTAIRTITAAFTSRKELNEAIELDLKNYFPFSVTELSVDFEILKSVTGKKSRVYKVLLATSPQKTIYEHLVLLEKFGIKSANFLPASYAFLKMASRISREDKNICFLDLGNTFTEALLFKGKDFVLSHKINLGGKEFTAALSALLDLSKEKIELTPSEAEIIKRQIGLPIEEDPKIIDSKVSTAQILSSFEPLLDKLINEISKCLDSFSRQTQGEKIDKFLLFGGGVYFKNLARFISKSLALEVETADPFEKIAVGENVRLENQQKSALFAAVIGAALSQPQGVNLAPAEIKKKARQFFREKITAISCTVIFLLTIFSYLGLKGYKGYLERKITVAKMKLVASQAKIKKNNSIFLINRILSKQPYWQEVFREISNIVPEEIYFTELNFKNNIFEIKGTVSGESKKETLSSFITALEGGVFKNIKSIAYNEAKEGPLNEFVLECQLD